MQPSHRYFLVVHPDSRQTITVLTASETAEMFSPEDLAFFITGKPVSHDGKRYFDMQACVNVHCLIEEPRASVIDRMRKQLARVA